MDASISHAVGSELLNLPVPMRADTCECGHRLVTSNAMVHPAQRVAYKLGGNLTPANMPHRCGSPAQAVQAALAELRSAF